MNFYRFYRALFRVAIHVFFSRIEVEGTDRIPETGAVLLVPNHSNALVDGMVVASTLNRPLVMTAKTALAGNRVLGLMMRTGNVVTLQRRQDIDQASEGDANTAAFQQIRVRLEQKMAVCLFPEGKSHSDPGIRKFKTGAARIAFDYLEHNPDGGSLKLVPVGLSYRRKSTFRSNAWIGFGEQLDVRQWQQANPDAGVRELTGLLENRVRQMTLDFKDAGQRDLFRNAADLLATGGAPPSELGLRPAPRLAEQVRLVKVLKSGSERMHGTESDRLQLLEQRIQNLFTELERRGVAPHETFLEMHTGRAAFFILRELELVLLGLPMALWGVLNNFPAYLAARALTRKLSHEDDQVATNAIFSGIISFPLFYFLQVLLASTLLGPGWLLLYALSVPWCGAYAVAWLDRIRGTSRRSRTWYLWHAKPELQQSLTDEARGIISEILHLGEQLEEDHGIRT